MCYEHSYNPHRSTAVSTPKYHNSKVSGRTTNDGRDLATIRHEASVKSAATRKRNKLAMAH